MLEKKINIVKKKLITKAKRYGMSECFGQKELRKLDDEYIDVSDYSVSMNNKRNLLKDFDVWCYNFNL